MFLYVVILIWQSTAIFGMNVNQVMVTGMYWTKDSIAEGNVIEENSK